MRLDLLGIYVLAIAENDHVLAASGDKEIAARVKVTEITGVEPSVFQDLGCSIRTVVVTLHDDGPANQDFARTIIGVLPWALDSNFIAWERLAD